MDIYRDLAAQIKKLREEQGKKSQDVAGAIGIHPTVYSKFENHGKKLPLNRIEQILNYLGCSLEITQKKTLLIS